MRQRKRRKRKREEEHHSNVLVELIAQVLEHHGAVLFGVAAIRRVQLHEHLVDEIVEL